MNIGDLCTVTYEQSKQLRKEGWKPRNDVVVMMFVGVPDNPRQKASEAAKKCWRERRERNGGWTEKQHAFAARKLAEACR